MACGPRFAVYGPSLLRARPPRVSCASKSRTLAPCSALVMAAVNPATPPPITVISFIAGHGTASLACRKVPVMAHETGPVDLLINLDRRGERPLHEQLEGALRDAVRDGRLKAG